MDTRPAATSERNAFKVDYSPHRIRFAGKATRADVSVSPHDVALAQEVAQISTLEAETVSEEISVAR
jgi:hypothetical protein